MNGRRENELGRRLDSPAAPFLSLAQVARALTGKIVGGMVRAAGPGHSRADDSLIVWLDTGAPDGFLTFSHAGDDWRACRDHVRTALGITSPVLNCVVRSRPRSITATVNASRTADAMVWWRESSPLSGTLGERYLIEHRQLPIGNLGDDLSQVLRWHAGRRCVVGLMTDPATAAPVGVHRTFLATDASKIARRMIGKQGIVRLSADDSVTLGLGITEGVEDGLAVMLTGWMPIWVATSAGAIERFPVLSGIEALTLFADADTVGLMAAKACAARWRAAGREATILPPCGNGGSHV